MALVALVLFVIFFLLAGIHFNWALGGSWGNQAAIPTKVDGSRVMNPGKADSAIVGIGLLAFGIFYLLQAGLFEVVIPAWIPTYAGWVIPAIFLLRAIGDFKYVGFFKKVKATKFGQADSQYFSPLCLAISVLGFSFRVF